MERYGIRLSKARENGLSKTKSNLVLVDKIGGSYGSESSRNKERAKNFL